MSKKLKMTCVILLSMELPPKEKVVPIPALPVALLVVAGSSILGTSSMELSSVPSVLAGDGGFTALLIPSVSTVGLRVGFELLVSPALLSFCFDRIPQPNKRSRFLRTFDLLDPAWGAAAAVVMAAAMMCDESTISSSAIHVISEHVLCFAFSSALLARIYLFENFNARLSFVSQNCCNMPHSSLIQPNHVMAVAAPSLAAAATLLANLRTVIIRPATPENVGMIARSLRCCGITQNLTLLSPQFDMVLDTSQSQSSGRSRTNFDVSVANPNRINPRVKKTASGALDVLKRTRVVDRWESATADCSLVIGASSRPLVEQLDATISSSGDKSHAGGSVNPVKPTYTPRECINMILKDCNLATNESVAVVFGPEHGGLSDDEMRKCDAFLCIPTDPTFPSLNLAMVVQIWAYEVRLATMKGNE